MDRAERSGAGDDGPLVSVIVKVRKCGKRGEGGVGECDCGSRGSANGAGRGLSQAAGEGETQLRWESCGGDRGYR